MAGLHCPRQASPGFNSTGPGGSQSPVLASTCNAGVATLRITNILGPSQIDIDYSGSDTTPGHWTTTRDVQAIAPNDFTPVGGAPPAIVIRSGQAYRVVVINPANPANSQTWNTVYFTACGPSTGGGGGGGGGSPNYTLTFTNNTSGAGPFTCVWDMGDGNTRNSACDPGNQFTYTYASVPNTYTVALTVTDRNGLSAPPSTRTVTVPL